ncbi:Uncharacterized protein family (UPF0236) [Desulfitobacterium dehalogenans ATCC 51507]|uniref:Uncharacterized protein family (UPF0236) n=1 Tax=Desulfitobacterium dehalogenans (strain ATCC 51507 / DSM 9161 / JW/IU-DC1) TaxID=756499 RepID=I4ACK5_DESDJ|nr:UPF0236 family protein [Desulfitobacterium dehalogenans]AFM01690.1 Uncharacterized protein family (UPF0236) [Desulfitobacterium dehalogenans ATCC 51507]
MNSLTKEKITFKDIERDFYKIGCEVAKMLLQRFLEEIDLELAGHRDKAVLRHRGKKTTLIKTLMGEVSVDRAIYRKAKDDGSQEYVYLLDEALGMETIGFMSPNLVEKILEYSCEMSYREVAEAVSTLTNQTISHQGVWNIVQAVGEKQIEAEKVLVESFKRNEVTAITLSTYSRRSQIPWGIRPALPMTPIPTSQPSPILTDIPPAMAMTP